MEQTRHKYWKLYIEMALLALLCVSQYFGISALNLLLTVSVLGIHFLMDDVEQSLLGLLCAMPEFNLLNARIGSISLYYLMVMVFWLRYFQHHDWKISKTKLMVLLILLMLRLTSGEIRDTLTWFVLISVLVLTYGEDFFDKNIDKVILFTSVVFLFTSLAGYLMLRAGKSIYTGGNVWTGKVKSTRFAGIIGDPVFFSQCCSFFAAANLTLGCQNKRYLLPAVIFSGSFLLLCLESYAKTGMALIILCVLCSLVWFVWNRIQNKRTAMLAIFLVLVSAVALLLLVNYILTDTDNLIIQNYITRLSRDDLLTGRTDIWAHYISLLSSNCRSLFLALPHAQYSTMFRISNGAFFNDPHNILLESACLFGIIPTLCMFTLVFVLMYRCFVSRKGILWQMPICVMLASGFTLHGHQEFHYYTLVAIAISFLQIHAKGNAAGAALPGATER